MYSRVLSSFYISCLKLKIEIDRERYEDKIKEDRNLGKQQRVER